MPDVPTSVDIQPLLRIEVDDLEPAPLAAGAGSGNSLYDAEPGDGTWSDAPNAGAEAQVTPPFTAKSFTVLVQTAPIEFQISSDGGANYGDWIVLSAGVFSFDLSMTDVRVREDVDNGGAEYQIVSFA